MDNIVKVIKEDIKKCRLAEAQVDDFCPTCKRNVGSEGAGHKQGCPKSKLKPPFSYHESAEPRSVRVTDQYLAKFMRAKGEKSIADFMAIQSAHDAKDQWELSDFHNLFMEGQKGYLHMTHKELFDEFKELCDGLNTMELDELWDITFGKMKKGI